MSDKYILFSPVGNTDPVRGLRDGSMLHITRIYNPEKIYLYMTSEMLKLENKDKRFSKGIKTLGYKDDNIEFIYQSCEGNPNNFNFFYTEYLNLVHELENKYPNHKILVNISSGTPQMKSAAFNACALSLTQNTLPIQVDSPVKSSNKDASNSNSNYSLDEELELNEDNAEYGTDNFEDRTSIAKSENYIVTSHKEDIKNSILNYDYLEALTLAKKINNFVDKDLISLLEATVSMSNNNVRYVYNYCYSRKSFKGLLMPYGKDEKFYYLINLQVKLKKEMYIDYARAVTPLLDELAKYYLFNMNKKVFDFSKCITKGSNGYKLSPSQLPNDLSNYLNKQFTGPLKANYIAFSSMSHIIDFYNKDDDNFKNIIKQLRLFYEVRNLVTHQLVYIDKNEIEQKLSIDNIQNIQSNLEDFYKINYKINNKNTNIDLDLYTKINNKLISLL